MVVVVSNREWQREFAIRLSRELNISVVYISDKEKLTVDYLSSLAPEYVFFPHWSYIIPQEIYEGFRCVIFHMTDLPYGRGGSPLQNLIKLGHKTTMLSAIQCVGELDAGDIYLKKPLSLSGSAQEIYLRAACLSFEMMKEIICTHPQLKKQKGDVVVFKRRTPEQSDMSGLSNLESVYDHIRMLDADGYPHAYINVDGLHIEFSDAQFTGGSVKAKVTIEVKK